MSENRRTPKQMWMTIVVMLIMAGFYFFSAYQQYRKENKTPTPPPTAAQQSATQEISLPLVAVPGDTTAVSLPVAADADFDYYVLALSWSPDYCATDGSNDNQQCSVGRRLAFVLHGLWPQYEKGYPSNCSNENFPSSLKEDYTGLYPNTALFSYEWEKHGTCSGLTPEQYLAASKTLKEGVVIPAEYQSPAEPFRVTTTDLKAAFITANPGLTADGMAVTCSDSGRFLRELRLCFTLDGQPRACGSDVLKDASKSCGQPDFLVRSVK